MIIKILNILQRLVKKRERNWLFSSQNFLCDDYRGTMYMKDFYNFKGVLLITA